MRGSLGALRWTPSMAAPAGIEGGRVARSLRQVVAGHRECLAPDRKPLIGEGAQDTDGIVRSYGHPPKRKKRLCRLAAGIQCAVLIQGANQVAS